jgi:hypothetical protein
VYLVRAFDKQTLDGNRLYLSRVDKVSPRIYERRFDVRRYAKTFPTVDAAVDAITVQPRRAVDNWACVVVPA